MSELERIEQLEKEIRELKGLNDEGVPTYAFSKITMNILERFLNIEKLINHDKFKKWFDYVYTFSKEDNHFFDRLVVENIDLISDYNEEDLKVNMIIPLLNRVKFKSFENNFRGFYELPMEYKTEKFIFNGTTDFLVAKGLIKSQKPYFFIQEFKKGRNYSDPEPQLLAELISAIELNDEREIKGAYIVGAIWNFVVLEKIGEDAYKYFVSQNFDSTKIGDLSDIYKNLMFIKDEIIEKIQNEK
ncbi:MAG: hypothetical protein QM493_03635 [Sulfurovum sp.]